MDKETLNKIKDKLAERKSQLEKELGLFAEKDKVVADDYKSKFPEIGDDEDENATEVAMYSDNLSLEHNLENSYEMLIRLWPVLIVAAMEFVSIVLSQLTKKDF